MKALLVLCLGICMVSGCATWQPIANAPGDLSQHFNDGGVLHAGDRVLITTMAGARHDLRIVSVHDGVIYGEHDSVAFSEVSSIERRDVSTTKTTILVVVIVGVAGALAAAINSASHPHTGL